MRNSTADQEKSFTDEIHLRDILDKMIEGVQVISYDWRLLYVNDAVVKQSHFSKAELVGYTLMERYPGIEHTPVFALLKECMHHRTVMHTEVEFEFPDKRHAWFELSIQPVQEGIFILSIDITERKQAEDKLRTSEIEYRSLIEQATDGIFISDDNGRYIDVNESACTMLGYTKEELLTMGVRDLLIKDEARTNPPRFDLLKRGKTLLTTRNVKRKDGTIISVEVSSKMMTNGNILGMVRDVTERKKAEKKLLAAEEQFRKLTETAFDAIVLMSEKGDIIFWNRGAELIFGYEQNEVFNKPLTLIMPEEYRQRHISGLHRYLKTGEEKVIGKVVELVGRKKSGEQFPIEISITSWESGSGKIFSGIIRDISERRAAEIKIHQFNQELEAKISERTIELQGKILELKESEERFQKAFHASAAGISITRLANSKIVDLNDALTQITEYSREELIGRSSLDLGLIVQDNRWQKLVDQVQKTSSARHHEISMRSKSGRIRHVLCSVEIILLNNERYSLSLVYDITERRLAQKELEIANHELEAFTYSVSHDLQAPLRSIIGYSQMLAEDLQDRLTAESQKTIGVIQKNANGMNQLIEDLLRFAKLGKAELHKSEVSTQSIVNNCLKQLMGVKPVNASVIVKPLSIVYGDWELLDQVWFNLISNAIKYSSKANAPVVEIGEIKTEREIIFYVKDNGAGFDMKYADKLFIVFQRLHSTKQFEGTGVGLSIVKRIINKHGGRVWAQSAPNEGATFYFSLPVKN